METDASILDSLPVRLKEARKAQGLSLDAVANLSGVSRSMVSQIARGESSPTISTLWNLTRALNVDFAGLLDERKPRDSIDVLKAESIPTIGNMGKGCRVAILSPPEDAGGHEVYEVSFSAEGALKSQPHARGTMDQVTVIDGSVRVHSGAAESLVLKGDTARYAADVPHEIAAVDGAARVFLIVKNV